MNKLFKPPSKAWFFLKNHPKKVILLFLISVVLIFVAFVAFTYFYYSDEISDSNKLITYKNTGITFYDKNEKFLYATDSVRNIKIISEEEIPNYLKEATLAIEDNNFYNHSGVSVRGIGRSIVNNIRTRDVSGAGGSTITQQLIKNSLLSQNKSIIRKLQEIILALVVEQRYGKDEILQLYLSSVFYGEGSYGAEDAAETYFDKNLKELNISESALIAGLTAAPSVYSPLLNPELAKDRQKVVLEKMLSLGSINQSEYEEAVKYEIIFDEKEADTRSPHFVLWLKEEVEINYQEELEEGNLEVFTTIDPVLQKRAEVIVKSHVNELSQYGANNGALLSIENKTGEVLAMVGSADWFDDENNGKYNSVFANRQPGSSFKPIVYITAFMNSYTPATVLHDKLTEFEEGYEPTNFDDKFRGDVLSRRALASSINVPTVELGQKVGIDKVLETARNLGITTLDKEAKFYGPNLALGGGEVQLFELTNVFATFARGGSLVPIIGIKKIIDKNDDLIFKSLIYSKRVVDRQSSFLITNILSDDGARSEVFGREGILKTSRPTAVKTGTTDEFKDSWTIGYSPSLTTGVWLGNTQSNSMDYIAGAIGAAPIWNEFMEFALIMSPIEEFEIPDGVVTVKICKNDGLLAKKDAKNSYLEYFVEGTAPKKSGGCK